VALQSFNDKLFIAREEEKAARSPGALASFEYLLLVDI
jgi:hypothetical protein